MQELLIVNYFRFYDLDESQNIIVNDWDLQRVRLHVVNPQASSSIKNKRLVVTIDNDDFKVERTFNDFMYRIKLQDSISKKLSSFIWIGKSSELDDWCRGKSFRWALWDGKPITVNVKISDLSLNSIMPNFKDKKHPSIKFVEFINWEVRSDLYVVLKQKYNIDDSHWEAANQGNHYVVIFSGKLWWNCTKSICPLSMGQGT